jgi:hypothetical protein
MKFNLSQRVVAAAALAFGAASVHAGECPADQRRANGTGQPMSAIAASGVTDAVITAIELAQPWRPAGAAADRVGRDHRVRQHLRGADPAQGRRHHAGAQSDVALVEEHRSQAGGDLCVRPVPL